MVTYYSDKLVQVTSDAIRVGDRRYPLGELARVWHAKGARSWRAVAGRGAIGIALLGPLAAAGIGIAVALTLHTSLDVTIAIVGVSCLLGLGVGPLADVMLERMDRSYARGSRSLEIWATWRGQPVLLLQTGDALRFGQIYRALQRALESSAVR
ncbi:hypothetical protein GCM10022251_53030 [Phytohabitans flavus]|uniref:Uncharacterized protein n=1 Tax=Phytohabitans flavus TaxID=1076124 RepID=A0A6F8Y7W4_9ACTN|nr:DUF6232 family protein [Phytohabitans flavus]BCB82051.1 hypothetical protein Pflav_084610 [Phytohabitans flavus]